MANSLHSLHFTINLKMVDFDRKKKFTGGVRPEKKFTGGKKSLQVVFDLV